MNKKVKSIIMFSVGFCLYITIEVLFRGYSYPSMGIVGGLTIIILDKINNDISWDLDILFQCGIGAFIITGFEFIIGEFVKLFNLTPMWDYSNVPLNFDGVICLPFCVAWFGLSFIAIILADAINYYVFGEQQIPYYMMLGKVILKFKEK